MNGARRAYDIMKGHVLREWDRIQGVEHDIAEEELNASLRKHPPKPAERRPERSDAGIEENLYPFVADPAAVARRLLGVSPKAPFEEIRKTFERLNKRCAPSNFPDGTEAREQALEIQKRLHWAYQALTDHFDATEKRFKSLELE